MTNRLMTLILAGLAAWQPAAAPTHLDRVLRELADGRRTSETVRLETECLDQGRFVNASAYGTGVAVWNGERQGTLTGQEVFSLLRAFVSEGFAQMPALFGDETEQAAAQRALKMTCRVRFTAEGTAKEVLQLEKGEQSDALKRLARSILDAARAATRNAAPINSLNEGLGAVAAGRLAAETLRVSMRAGAVDQRDRGGWTLRIDGRDTELDPDVGSRTARRLEPADVRELARLLAESRFAMLPPSVRATEDVEVTVAVLGQEYKVRARPSPASGAQDPDIHARFEQAVAPLRALRERERSRE